MKQQSLFSNDINNKKVHNHQNIFMTPLANRMRPKTLNDFVGQENLLGKGKVLRRMVENNIPISFILWGPPGIGKTTLAEIIARHTKARFVQFSATDSSTRTIKKVMKKAQLEQEQGHKTVVFIDEIHRFNKGQQDAFLPFVENGSITLIGATTENPSFNINSALLSRCKVFVFHKLSDKNIEELIKRALTSKVGYPKLHIKITSKQIKLIAQFANGDARKALNTLEEAVDNASRNKNEVLISTNVLKQLMGRKFLLYDKKGDEHYDLISALHKSVRNSDVQSAIYWLYRMIDGGEDPLYIARREVRMSTEDIGLADPNALNICINAFQACKYIGLPECRLALVEAIIYLAVDPKSNAVYKAGLKADHDVRKTKNLSVPLQIRNAPTKLMKQLGYHEHYKYAHNYKYHTTSMQTMPNELKKRIYYIPSNYGYESNFKNQMKWIKQAKALEKKYGNHKINNFKPMDLNQFD